MAGNYMVNVELFSLGRRHIFCFIAHSYNLVAQFVGSSHGVRNEIHNKQYSMNGRHKPFHHASSGCLQLLGRGCKPMR